MFASTSHTDRLPGQYSALTADYFADTKFLRLLRSNFYDPLPRSCRNGSNHFLNRCGHRHPNIHVTPGDHTQHNTRIPKTGILHVELYGVNPLAGYPHGSGCCLGLEGPDVWVGVGGWGYCVAAARGTHLAVRLWGPGGHSGNRSPQGNSWGGTDEFVLRNGQNGVWVPGGVSHRGGRVVAKSTNPSQTSLSDLGMWGRGHCVEAARGES